MAMNLNPFSRLRKWASRQDENFMTEALIVVIETLLDREPFVGVKLVNVLSGGLIDLGPDDASFVELLTQVSTEHGKPDFLIRSPGCLTVVETKVESLPALGQLERYREYLRKCDYSRKALVLLTKYRPKFQIGDEVPSGVLRWYELTEALEREMAVGSVQEPVSRYICCQFLDF